MTDSVLVAALRRFPVKSLLGERRPYLDLDARGCVGDRAWSVRTAEGKIGSGKNTRRFAAVPGLLDLRAREQGGAILVEFPDGTELPIDSDGIAERLSAHLGRPVTVAKETDVSHFDDGPISLAGTASIDALALVRGEPVDPSRFRANVLLATHLPFEEVRWVGRRVTIGTAVLRVEFPSPRCVMVDMATADLPEQHGNLLALGRINDANLGVIATVEQPGRIAVGDLLTVD
jgi:uncharacterized protein YcbX